MLHVMIHVYTSCLSMDVISYLKVTLQQPLQGIFWLLQKQFHVTCQRISFNIFNFFICVLFVYCTKANPFHSCPSLEKDKVTKLKDDTPKQRKTSAFNTMNNKKSVVIF